MFVKKMCIKYLDCRVRSLRLRALRVRALRIRALRVRALRVRALRVRALRVRALRVRALRIRALRLTSFSYAICSSTAMGQIEWLGLKLTKTFTVFTFIFFYQGIARTQSPTNKNYALELNTFGPIVRVSPPEVQWESLTLEEPPS